MLSLLKKSTLSFHFFVWAAFFESLFITAVSCRFLVNTEGWAVWQFLYFFVFVLGNFFFLSLIVLGLLGYPLARLGLKKSAVALTLALCCAGLIFIVADTFVYGQYRLHINLAMLEMTFLGGGQIVSFTPAMLFEIALLCLGVIIVSSAAVWAAIQAQARHCTTVWFVLPVAVSFLAVNLLYAYAFPIIWNDVIAINEKIPLNRPLRMSGVLLKLGVIDQKDIDRPQFSENSAMKMLNYPLSELQCLPRKKFNIVFLLVDSMRYDMLDQQIMPNLSRFSKTGTVFANHYAGGNGTRMGIFSLFYGIPGSYWFPALGGNTPSVLIQALQKTQYDIGVFASAPLTRPEFHATVFSSVPNLRVVSDGVSSLERDRDSIEDFMAWHQHRPTPNAPFFSFVFLDNVHAYEFPENEENTVFKPYWKTINHLELSNDFDPVPYFNRYKNAVHYADRNIEKVLDYLKQKGLLDSTIVVVTSDHGEEFNDNKQNYWSHGGNYTDAEVKVPMVVHWPGRTPGTVSYMTSMNDVVATLLPEALGCKNPVSDYSVGHPLWSQTGRRDWVYASGYTTRAIIEPERIVQINRVGRLEYLDKTNRELRQSTVPGYMGEAISEMTKYYK